MSASSDRRRRFERLERPRKDGPDGDELPDIEERFQDVTGAGEGRSGPAEPGAAASAALDRFGPARPRPPDVAGSDPGLDEQPFVRCRRCETDHSRYAPTCTTCGEPLHTEEQQAYNQKLWAARRAERDEVERVNGERRVAQAEAEVEAARARRQAYEEMAREVGRQERERLDRADEPAPVGIRLLRSLLDFVLGRGGRPPGW